MELANIQFYVRNASALQYLLIVFKGIINFIKNIPEFDFFKTDNQVRIIRSCTVEVFLVNLALFYDETRDVITIGNSSYPLSSMAEVGVSENGLREFRTTLLALDKMQLTERESSLVGFFNNIKSVNYFVAYRDDDLFRRPRKRRASAVRNSRALRFFASKDTRWAQIEKGQKPLPCKWKISFHFIFVFQELIFLLSSVRRISTRLRPYLQTFTCQYPDLIPPLIKEIND